MRVAAFASPDSGSTQYRVYQPMRELARRGHDVTLKTFDDEVDDRIRVSDVAYFQRYLGGAATRRVQRLKDAGVATVWDIDDDIMSSELMRAGAMHSQRMLAAIRAMVATADIVTTTRDSLAETYRELGADCVRVVPNYLARVSTERLRRPHDGVVIGWIAWRDHQEDWRRLGLESTMRRLLDAHPGLRVESVGPIDLGLPKERYRRTGPLPFDDLPAAIAQFDIGIAPIADVPFNRSRSDIKIKEYAIAGVPWLASAIGPYAALGEKQGGRLVPDDRWHEELERLIVQPRARRKLGRRATRWAEKQTLAEKIGMWEAVLSEAIERARARRSA
jgi:hypothetical protein